MNNIKEIFSYHGNSITMKKENGIVYVNATEMAKSFNEKPANWLRNEQSSRLIQALSVSQKCDTADLVKVTQGGNEQGTWFHEDVALLFSQWLSPEFYILCNNKIKELLQQGYTKIDTISKKDLAKMLLESEEEKEKLQSCIDLQESELKKQAPKIEYYNAVLQSQTLIPTTSIAKELGMSANTLNRMLCNSGIQYKIRNQWVLYHKYQNKGYTGTKTTIYKDSLDREQTQVHTYWTEKGKEFILSLALTKAKRS